MIALLPQQIAIALFLFSCLIAGFLHKINHKTVKEYALGRNTIITPVLMATMVAATVEIQNITGGSIQLYQNGLWLFFALLAMPVGYSIMSLVIIPKLSKYYGCFSVVEIIGKMYGHYARKVTGVIAFLFCLAVLSIHIKIFYYGMESIFADNALFATIVGVSIVILYSSMGGASSVIKTGVIQFLIFLVILPLIAGYIIKTSGGVTQITTAISKMERPFLYNGDMASFIGLAIFYLLPDLYPAYFHRLLIGRDCKKNQTATYVLAFVSLLIIVFVGCIAFIALSKFPNIQPQDALSVVVKDIITNQWARLAFKISLFAIVVSGIDALVNTSAVILTHDVFPAIKTEQLKLTILKGMTILSGIIAMALACFPQSVLGSMTCIIEYYFIVLSVPFIAALFIKEPSKESFWASAIVGSFTFTMVSFAQNHPRYEAFLVALMFSLTSYLAVFFALRRPASSSVSFSIKSLCDRIIEKHAIRLDHLSYMIFGCFLLSVFGTARDTNQYVVISLIEFVTGALGFSLLFIDKSELRYKNVIALFTVFYCFAFSPAYVFLLQEADNNVSSMIFIGSIVLLAVLFSWDIFLSWVLTGSFTAVLTFYCLGPGDKNLIAPIINLSLLIGIMSLLAFVVFRNRERGVMEYIENKLRASNETELANQKSQIIKQTLLASKTSLQASNRYRDVLLYEDKTIMVSFDIFKENVLAYFQQMSVERRTKLTIVNTRYKVLSTGLPLGFFYKTIYSVIANVFHFDKGGGEIVVRFVCSNSGKIEAIEISHGGHASLRMDEIAKYLQVSHAEDILGWNVLLRLFEQLEIKVTETNKKLKIIFPSESKQDDDNLVGFKESLQIKPEPA